MRREGQWLWFEPVYRTYFVLVVSPVEDIPRRLKRLKLKDEVHARLVKDFAGLQPGGAYSVSRGLAAIWLGPTADLNVVAHEATHAVCQLFRHRWLPLSETSEEAYAYYVGYVTTEIERRSAR